jgi:hypothetical protein
MVQDADKRITAADGTVYGVRPDGSVYRMPSFFGGEPVEITKKELDNIDKPRLPNYLALSPTPANLKLTPVSSNNGGGNTPSAPSKANNAGATLPANSEKIDIRISDEILEEVTRLTLDIMQDSADLIPFDLSFNSIDFIPEREVFSADNETRYGIYFEDTETDQFIDVRNTESEDISLGIIRTKITDLNQARRNGTRRYFDAFTVKYDSNGTPEISLKIDTGTTGIDGLDVIILQIKDNIESFTRQDPPS